MVDRKRSLGGIQLYPNFATPFIISGWPNENATDATISTEKTPLKAEKTRSQLAAVMKNAPTAEVVKSPRRRRSHDDRIVPGTNSTYTRLVRRTIESSDTPYSCAAGDCTDDTATQTTELAVLSRKLANVSNKYFKTRFTHSFELQ